MFPENSKATKQKSSLIHHYLTAVLALTALITSPQIKAEDDFTGLGFFPDAAATSFALGISADGSVVVGYGYNANGNAEAFRWVDGTMTGLGFLPCFTLQSIAKAISADGSVVVGYANDSFYNGKAFRWKLA